MCQYYLGVDIGGTHISCALVDTLTGKILHNKIYTAQVDSNGSCRCQKLYTDTSCPRIRHSFTMYTDTRSIGKSLSKPTTSAMCGCW